MAARALSTATISFGLVSIPIKLFTTSEPESRIHFHMVDKEGARLKQQYVSSRTGEIIPREEMLKGYQVAKDQYVLFSNEEIKALEEEATRMIEITEFVPAEQVDPLFFERAYYLGPDKGGAKPYRLLGEAMRQTGRSALARYAARGKQYLVLIRPFQDGLVMQQLRYADEIKSFDEIETGDAEPRAAELDLAIQLIEQISSDEFRPQEYEDEVKKRLEEVIQQRVAGQQVTFAPAAEPQAQIIDLMEALHASLADDEQRKGPKPAMAKKVTRRKKAARK